MDFSVELSKLKNDFLANQNGVVVGLMEKRGIQYAENYGLSAMQIKALAAKYKPNHRFADFLFRQEIREAKLISFQLAEADKIAVDNLDAMVESFSNAEEVEQACLFLLDQVKAAPTRAIAYCQKDSDWVKMTGYLLLARLSLKGHEFEKDNLKMFFEFVQDDCETGNTSVRNAISRALRALAEKGPDNRTKVKEVCLYCEKSGHRGAAWIAEEVKMVIE